jgi:hypothetical protein
VESIQGHLKCDSCVQGTWYPCCQGPRHAAADVPGVSSVYKGKRLDKMSLLGKESGDALRDLGIQSMVFCSQERRSLQLEMIRCIQYIPGPVEVVGTGTVRLAYTERVQQQCGFI